MQLYKKLCFWAWVLISAYIFLHEASSYSSRHGIEHALLSFIPTTLIFIALIFPYRNPETFFENFRKMFMPVLIITVLTFSFLSYIKATKAEESSNDSANAASEAKESATKAENAASEAQAECADVLYRLQ